MIRLFHPYIPEAFGLKVQTVLKEGWVGQGAEVEQFEDEFARYVGARFAVMTNSATAALNLAVEVSGIEEGDAVLTTALTFVSTNHAILNSGGTPVFVDIEPDTLNIDLKKAQAAITSKTKAIMVVHYAGNPVNMSKLYELAEFNNLKVIEDASHACGASYNGKNIGSFGLTCFSFAAVKNLPIGSGGMVVTNDGEEYRRLRSLLWLGIDRTTYSRSKNEYRWEYDVPVVGYHYSSNDIVACIGRQCLKQLAIWNGQRQALVELYKKNLQRVWTLTTTPGAVSANHLFVVQVPDRRELHDRLQDAGVESGVHYTPNTYYPMYKGDWVLPETNKAYNRMLSLPLHLRLSQNDIVKVCEIVNQYA